MIGLFVREPKAKNYIAENAFAAIEHGLQKMNIEYFRRLEREGYHKCDIAIVFSAVVTHPRKRLGCLERKEIYERQGSPKKLIAIERGFIKRNLYHSVGWNHINRNADFCNTEMPSDRSEKLNIKLQDWRSGENIVICSQIPWDVNVQNTDHQKWCNQIVKEIRKFSDRTIVFRPHPVKPKAVDPPSDTTVSFKDFQEDLVNAHAVVCYNSNSAVEAVLAGVPAFVSNQSSMAWEVSNHDISDIELPKLFDRAQWINNLAYSQWTVDEMAEGLPLIHLGIKGD